MGLLILTAGLVSCIVFQRWWRMIGGVGMRGGLALLSRGGRVLHVGDVGMKRVVGLVFDVGRVKDLR